MWRISHWPSPSSIFGALVIDRVLAFVVLDVVIDAVTDVVVIAVIVMFTSSHESLHDMSTLPTLRFVELSLVSILDVVLM